MKTEIQTAASLLGRMARGHSKTLTPAREQHLRERMQQINAQRKLARRDQPVSLEGPEPPEVVPPTPAPPVVVTLPPAAPQSDPPRVFVSRGVAVPSTQTPGGPTHTSGGPKNA